jgi:sodium/bile acid cotransporter 7
MLRRLFPDPFIFWLIGAVLLGSLLPVRGVAAQALDSATLAAIFLLFFLHGVRLPREALKSGLTDWRLHLAILGVTYLVFPAIGLTLRALAPGLLTPALWAGILFLCALPSTVQSSIAFTSMAGGNVAGAVAAAAASNLLGVLLTPLLVSLMLSASGADFNAAGIVKIVLLLLLPFVAGTCSGPGYLLW